MRIVDTVLFTLGKVGFGAQTHELLYRREESRDGWEKPPPPLPELRQLKLELTPLLKEGGKLGKRELALTEPFTPRRKEWRVTNAKKSVCGEWGEMGYSVRLDLRSRVVKMFKKHRRVIHKPNWECDKWEEWVIVRDSPVLRGGRLLRGTTRCGRASCPPAEPQTHSTDSGVEPSTQVEPDGPEAISKKRLGGGRGRGVMNAKELGVAHGENGVRHMGKNGVWHMEKQWGVAHGKNTRKQ